jgi:hypothetical protein
MSILDLENNVSNLNVSCLNFNIANKPIVNNTNSNFLVRDPTTGNIQLNTNVTPGDITGASSLGSGAVIYQGQSASILDFNSITGDGSFATVTPAPFITGGNIIIEPGPNAVLTTAVQTLTNKTLTSPIISTISNTGTITVPSTTGTLALTSQIPSVTNTSVVNDVCTFSNTSGAIQDSGILSTNLVTLDGTQTLTNKTLTSPIISSITNTGTLTLSTVTGTVPTSGTSTTSGNIVTYNSSSGAAIQDSGFTILDTGDQSTTYSGIWATSKSATVRAFRIGPLVTITGTEVLATANTAAQISIAYTLPSAYRPTVVNGTSLYTAPIIVDDNGTWQQGTINISTGGAMTITNTTNLGASGNFAGTGQSGPTAWSVYYLIQ